MLSPDVIETLIDILAIAWMLMFVIAVVGSLQEWRTSATRREIERRAHVAGRDIDDIGQRTQAAILEEARRRAQDKGFGR